MSAARTTRLFAAAVVAAMSTAQTTARAGDTSDLQDLLNETVITTASKSQEKGSTAPAISTILTAEDIRNYGIHSIDEAIDFLSLGTVTSNTLRAADIGARGVLIPNDQGDHVLLLIDGHAVNEPLYGAARFERGAGIPMEMVDHIEVILGPGSVLYGSNAMLGVVNVVTKHARAFEGAHAVVESEVLKSWRAAAGAGFEPKIFGAPGEVTFEVEYYRQSGPAFDVGPQYFGMDWTTSNPWRFSPTGPATGYWGGRASNSYYAQVPSGLLTLRLKNFEITLHGSTYKRAAPSNQLYLNSDSDFDDPSNYELDRSAWIDIKHKALLSSLLRLDTRLYADTFDYQRYMDQSAHVDCLFLDVVTCRSRTFGVSRWAGAEIQSTWDWLGNEALVTTIGVDGRARFVGSVSDRYDVATGRPVNSSTGVLRETDGLLGAYLQQTWRAAPWLALNAGGRLDLDPNYAPRVSPRGAISLRAWDGGTLKTIYSEAFRTPSWQETEYSSAQQMRAGDLSPETVRSVEASLDQKLGSHRLLFGVFRSWWNDLVELHVLSPDELLAAQHRGDLGFATRAASQFRNVASIENYGFNAGYEGSFAEGSLRYGANVTGAVAHRTSADDVTQPLAVAPQFFGNLRLSYALPGKWPTLAVATHYLAKRPADRAFDAGFSPPPFAPAQLELRGTVSGPIPLARGLSYRASVNYALASRGPYVIGPLQSGQSLQIIGVNGSQNPELNPVDVLRFTVGVQYDFGGSP
jgi:outer membrane receptor protein involved in Fe transport